MEIATAVTMRHIDQRTIEPYRVPAADVQADRVDVALDFVRDTRVHLILKGAHTVIYAPDGRRWINCTGNAAMATAGTGDMLAGLIRALLHKGFRRCRPRKVASISMIWPSTRYAPVSVPQG